MFTPDTILVLKDIPENAAVPAAYRRVRVIGVSPTNGHGHPWVGNDGQGVIIEPLEEFAGNLDEPFGKLNLQYDVEYVPETVAATPQSIKVIDSSTRQAGLTPEEQFAAVAMRERAAQAAAAKDTGAKPAAKSPRQKAGVSA